MGRPANVAPEVAADWPRCAMKYPSDGSAAVSALPPGTAPVRARFRDRVLPSSAAVPLLSSSLPLSANMLPASLPLSSEPPSSSSDDTSAGGAGKLATNSSVSARYRVRVVVTWPRRRFPAPDPAPPAPATGSCTCTMAPFRSCTWTHGGQNQSSSSAGGSISGGSRHAWRTGA